MERTGSAGLHCPLDYVGYGPPIHTRRAVSVQQHERERCWNSAHPVPQPECSQSYCLPPPRSRRGNPLPAHLPACGTATGRYGVAKDRAYVSLVSQHESMTERAGRTSHAQRHRQKSRVTHWCGYWASETVDRDRGISSFSDRRCVAYRMEAQAMDEQARGAYRRRTVTFHALWRPAARCCDGNGTGAGIVVETLRATGAR